MLLSCSRYTPSQADVHVFKALLSAPDPSLVNVTRWYKHIASYAPEHASLSGSSKAGEAFISSAAPAPAEEDDEIDLFGEDEEEDEEAERVKAERVAAYNAKKANKPKTIAKVNIFSTSFQYVLNFDSVCCYS